VFILIKAYVYIADAEHAGNIESIHLKQLHFTAVETIALRHRWNHCIERLKQLHFSTEAQQAACRRASAAAWITMQ